MIDGDFNLCWVKTNMFQDNTNTKRYKYTRWI